MASLEGKVIAITGAASGIGLATAHLLASRGASLSLADVRQDPLEAAVSSIQKSSPNAKIYRKAVDVSKASEVDTWLEETIHQMGSLHGAVNLAGVVGTTGLKNIKDLTDDDWDLVMNINLKGVFNCLRAELRRAGEGASIVNAASVAGLKGIGKGAPYSASKHGVIGLSKSAAIEEGSRKIRVNCIAPGPIETPMIQTLKEQFTDTSSAEGSRLCIKRSGEAEEVAKLIAFLLSDESAYTTGSVYQIDGGYMT